MQTREEIEQSGKGARWEFDGSKLFPKTDYSSFIAQHLSEIAVVLLEFTNFFGPEIKQVKSFVEIITFFDFFVFRPKLVGDSRRVDDALKNVYLLVKPFIEVGFDPFLSTNSKFWTDLLETMRKDVQILEAEAKSFIDEAFMTVK
jgi:dynein heavy chain